MVLDENSITQTLRKLVEQLAAGDLATAKDTLDVLDFERLLHPVRDPNKGPLLFADPAQQFGIERTPETADHVRKCSSAISSGDVDGALEEARAAASRWSRS